MEEDGEQFLKKVDDVNDMIQLLLSTQDKEVNTGLSCSDLSLYLLSAKIGFYQS